MYNFSKIKSYVIFVTIFLISCSDEIKINKNEPLEEKRVSKVYNLKLGHGMPGVSPQQLAAEKFKEIVEKKSKGRLKIDIFPNQIMGTDQEMIQKAIKGDLDIILPPSYKLNSIVSSAFYLDLPFYFENRKELYRMLDGTPGGILKKNLLGKGLVGVAFWESGFKHFTANKEIHSPADLENLKFRTAKSPFLFEQYKRLGAKPYFIDFQKIPNALKDGVISAQENSLDSILNLKLYEHQSHLILSEHGYIGYLLTLSKKVYDNLPQDLQETLFAAGEETALYQRKLVHKKEKDYLEKLREVKVNIYKLTPKEKKKFKDQLKPVVERYRERIGFKMLELSDQIKSEQVSISNDEIVIGLDADLFAGSAPSGFSIKRGAQIAIEEINSEGGLLGKKLRLISKNHSGISARGIKNIEDFSKTQNLIAVLGGLHSPVALAEIDLLNKEKIIYLGPWAAATKIVENGKRPNYIFRVSVRDEFAGPFLARQALKRYKKIALLLENTGWGRGNYKSMTSALKKEGVKPVTVQWFNWGEPNFYEQIYQIKSSGAEVIILVANSPEGKTFIKNMKKRRVSIPILSHWGITGGNFGWELKEELQEIDLEVLQTFSFITAKNNKTRSFLKKYFKFFRLDNEDNIIAPVGTAHAYDLIHLLALAVKSANSLDRSKIRDALEEIQNYDGLVKNYRNSFTSSDHDALDSRDFFLAEFDENGRIIPKN
ncbi:MAG: DctP family TRAP transporter solute-binding subunit [Nitrospinae bacterium]|nr:DctP family TRAP transporter solute-binding subunit [Nitrospinota bacterium]